MRSTIEEPRLLKAFALGVRRPRSFDSSGTRDRLFMMLWRNTMLRRSPRKVPLTHLVQNWLSDNADMFWSKEFWPPNSPDLNPLDYYVWSVVERVTNKSRHPNVASLRAAIEAAFANMDSAALQRACGRFRTRMEAVIEANGGYI